MGPRVHAQTCADSVGAMSKRGSWTCADSAGTRERWKLVGRRTVGMSERGCADVCGQNGRKGKVEMDGEKDGHKRAWMCGRVQGLTCKKKRPVDISEHGCAEVCRRCGCKRKVEIGGGRTGGLERAWMRGRVQAMQVQGKGWKWVVKSTGGHERASMRGRVHHHHHHHRRRRRRRRRRHHHHHHDLLPHTFVFV